MKAVIMAGGSGKRLRPLTSTIPKPMVRMFGRPVISYIFDLLRANSFDDVTVTLGYMAERIEDYILNGYDGKLKLTSVREAQPLGTAGSVKNATKHFEEPFLVISGDCICDFRLDKIMENHVARNADVTIVCTKAKDPREYGVVEVESGDKVKGFTEKPSWSGAVSDCVNTGIYVINPEIMRYVKDGEPCDFSKDVFPALLRDGRIINAYTADGYWCDIGNVGAYRQCCKDVFDGKISLPLTQVAQGMYVSGTLPDGKYSVVPPCYIGRDVEIGDGAVVGPYCVIDDGCMVGANSKIRHSFMMPYSVTYGNSLLSGTVLCENSVVKSGVKISDGSVIGASSTVNENTVIGRNVSVLPETEIERASCVMKSLEYSTAAKSIFSDEKITGTLGVEMDAVTAAIIGQALASTEIGKKAGIATDGKSSSKAVAHMIIGAMMSHGSHIWNFCESFWSQLVFYVSFCGLKSGLFVYENNSVVSVRICGENGLPLSDCEQREIENRIKYREFNRCSAGKCRDVSDMSGVGLMYRRELIKQSENELSDVSCMIKCANEKIGMLIEDCLYRLGCRQSDEMTFRINYDGTALSAFHRDCGWIPHDRLMAICCQYETENGRDIAVPYDAPRVLDAIAFANGREVKRFFTAVNDDNEKTVRELAAKQVFLHDALFMAVRLLSIISETGKTLAQLHNKLPDFHISRKTVNISFPPSELKKRCVGDNCVVTRQGISINYPEGTVHVTASNTGRMLSLVSEANNYEFSKDLCSRVEKLVNSNKEKE